MKHFDKAALVILDGWGHGPIPERSAIAMASTPFMDSVYQKYPNTELVTYGTEVGLPEGQMGNSEVGHLNIGAGRIVYQELERINVAIKTGELFSNPTLLAAVEYCKSKGKALHLMGLVSDGGVHSHMSHLLALCKWLSTQDLKEIYIHAFTDGRDTDPKSGFVYLEQLLETIRGTNIKLASVCGRYYAMDRDKRWERVKLAYDLLVKGEGEHADDILATIAKHYAEGVTDEFLKPISFEKAVVKEGDAVFSFNFRTDRCREITEVLTQVDKHEFGMHKLELKYLTMTRYDDTFKGVDVVFEKDNLEGTLGEVLAKNGKTQLRTAETEKYPHVTFFFSGGREEPFAGETRKIAPSPKVATYDMQPEMSAYPLCYQTMEEVRINAPDFICLNFANTDMVGHTGDFKAAMYAAETVDFCMSKLVPVLLEKDYAIIVIADHGNSDYMINDDGTPNTAHTTNPVPCIFVANDTQGLSLRPGKLGDVAPTLLALLGLDKSPQMDGESLFV